MKSRGSLVGRRLSGLTLVELLVSVVMVIALALILVSVTRGMRTQSGVVGCLSNLRQIAAGVGSYMADQNGYLPPIHLHYQDSTGAHIVKRWWIELSPYLPYKAVDVGQPTRLRELSPKGRERVYLCPSNSRIAQLPGANAYVNYTGILEASGHTLVSSQYFREFRKKPLSFRSPVHQLPYLIDGYLSPAQTGSVVDRPDYVNVFVSIKDAVADINPTDLLKGSYVPVHGSSIAVLYIDGHVELIASDQFRSRTYSYAVH